MKPHVPRLLNICEAPKITTTKTTDLNITWEEFAEKLKTPEVTPETFAEYCAMSKTERGKVKDVGYFVGGQFKDGKRCKENLLHRDELTLDYDENVPVDYPFSLAEYIGGYEWVTYTTHSHSPDDPRIRLVIPLTRSVTPEEYPKLIKKVDALVGFKDALDPGSTQPERAMFYPSHSKDAEFEFYHNKGAWLDPDVLLAEEPEPEEKAPQEQQQELTDLESMTQGRTDLSTEQMKQILSMLDPDMSREQWLRVGMGLHHEFIGSNEGLQLFDSWSASKGSVKYESGDCARVWNSFKQNPNNPTTFKSVIAMAQQVEAKKVLEIIHEKTLEQFGCTVTPEAQKIADRLHQILIDKLEVNPEENQEGSESIKPDAERITRMINGAFWSGSSSKLFLLNHSGDLVRFTEKDAFYFLALTFGNPVDRAAVATLAQRLTFGKNVPEAEEKERQKHINECMGIVSDAIIKHLKYYNQRESIEWRVDMFAQHSRMEIIEDKARIVLTHKAFEEFNKPERYAEIVADYKEHFTRFDEFLQFIVMSRFALDRKKSHLWILGSSDWGKDFVMGTLPSGACVSTSMTEVEKMFEGNPVGRTAEEFKRALVLHINEFKTVKAELKQLQSEITFAPKHQLTCSVEIFAKVFTSAESVASLVGENGVEDQFANRMSIFEERGNITQRPLFEEVGNARYFRAIKAYVSRYLNTHISDMQKLGREKSEATAEQWLDGFIGRYGLDTKYERFSQSLPVLAEEIKSAIGDPTGFFCGDYRVIGQGQTIVYLTSPGKVVDEYIEKHFSQSEVTSIKKKKNELYALMSEDGKGIKKHRIDGSVKSAIKLKM